MKIQMDTKALMGIALGVQPPWHINNVTFDVDGKRLDIHIDFDRGTKFPYKSLDEGISGSFPVYDTVDKEWRHLNFFQHECYLHARVPRIDAGEGRIRMIDPPWAGVCDGFTLLFKRIFL